MENDSLTIHIHVIKDAPAIVCLPQGQTVNENANELRCVFLDEQDNTTHSYALEIDEESFKKLGSEKVSVIAHFHDGCECVGIFKFVNKARVSEIITFCPDPEQKKSGKVPIYGCKKGL